MDNTFQIGDVVVLKSDSPKLTVMSIQNHLIECAFWHEAASKIVYTGNQDYGLFNKAD